MKRFLSREPMRALAKRFSRVSGTRHKASGFKVQEKKELWLKLAAMRWLWRLGLGVLASEVEL